MVAVKGAPEAIFGLCHLNDAQTAQQREKTKEMAEMGLRVLVCSLLHLSFALFIFKFHFLFLCYRVLHMAHLHTIRLKCTM